MKDRLLGLTIIIILAFFSTVECQSDIWNRLVRLESNLTDIDYYNFGSQNSDVYRGPFTFELLKNGTFVFQIQYPQTTKNLKFVGVATPSQQFSILGKSYQLKSSKMKGIANYTLAAGLKWSLSLKIEENRININRSIVHFQYSNLFFLVAFGLIGFLLFPLCDRTKGRLMYNIKKRTHPILAWSILFKFCYFWICELAYCFYYTINLPWYYFLFTATVYLFSMAPSLPQSIYFLNAIQAQVKEYQWFQNQGATSRCLLMSLLFLMIPITVLLLFLVEKDVIFFFALSLPVIYQFIYSCGRRHYSFTGVLLYDLLLTALLTCVGLFLPVFNFSILTWKSVILFWNYYLGVLIFGFILSSKIIKMEIIEQVHLEEESNFDNIPHSDSERRQELPKIQTQEGLSQ